MQTDGTAAGSLKFEPRAVQHALGCCLGCTVLLTGLRGRKNVCKLRGLKQLAGNHWWQV
jgi:hypothetical protein